MKKILLAIEDSPCSTAAIDAVVAHARPFETEVIVVRAVEWPLTGPPYLTFAIGPAAIQSVLELRDRALETAKAHVSRVAARLRADGFDATGMVPTGDPAAVIVDVATTWKADLIVLGSHGRRGLDRLAMGSVAESVLRHAPCPVEIVRPTTPAAKAS